MPSPRYASLDYLRGLMALAVLGFHFQKYWPGNVWDASTVLGRLGVYAVSIFFVLSGLTMTLVYAQAPLNTWAGVRDFFKKRVARIFPLLWLVTLATFFLDLNLGLWSFSDLWLNLTGLFGVFGIGRDISLGAWSLGCELVFYAAFPMLWLIMDKKRPFLLLFVFVLAASQAAYFAFVLIERGAAFPNQYALYVNPAQHFFLFVAGCVLGFFQKKMTVLPQVFWQTILGLAVAAFVFWPTGSHYSELLFGTTRLVFSTLSVLVCAAVFGGSWSFSGKTHTVLTWLGDCSYTIFLLHPVVLRLIVWGNTHFLHAPVGLLLGFAFAATLLVSHVVYRYFEMPCKRWLLA